MPDDLGPSLLWLLLALGIAAFASGTEVAFLSLSRDVRQRLGEGTRLGSALYAQLVRKPRRLFRTLQLTYDLAVLGASAVLAHAVDPARLRAPEGLLVAGLALAFLPVSIVLGHVGPKSLAVPIAERWVKVALGPVAFLVLALAPVALVAELVSRLFLWATGARPTIRPRPEELLDEEEFRHMIDAGSKEGEIAPAEKAMIHRVLEFSDKTVGALMTPASQLFAISYELPMARIIEEVAKSPFSRVPVYRGRRDNVVGILLAKDLVAIAHGIERPRPLQSLLFPAYYAPRTTKCDQLFQQMQRRRTGLALIVDEYGRTCGLVTMGDLLEELFGDLARHVSVAPAGEVVEVPPEGDGAAAPEAEGRP